GIAAIKGNALLNMMNEFKNIIELVISKVIIPLLPFHIFGIFANMTHAGTVTTIISVFLKVFVLIIILHLLYLLFIYFRSEERRVGKECRCRLSFDDEKIT